MTSVTSINVPLKRQITLDYRETKTDKHARPKRKSVKLNVDVSGHSIILYGDYVFPSTGGPILIASCPPDRMRHSIGSRANNTRAVTHVDNHRRISGAKMGKENAVSVLVIRALVPTQPQKDRRKDSRLQTVPCFRTSQTRLCKVDGKPPPRHYQRDPSHRRLSRAWTDAYLASCAGTKATPPTAVDSTD